jgi:O-antigen/teichoic acid export membrane protein
VAEGIGYYVAKGTVRPATSTSTVLVTIPILGGGAVFVSEVLVGPILASLDAEALTLARQILLAIPIVLAAESGWTLLAARGQFGRMNASRLGQPLVFAAALMLLAPGGFSVGAALWSFVLSYFGAAIAAFYWLIRADSPRRPSAKAAGLGLRYGLRLQGVTLAALGSGRLDMLILPMFVTTTAIGYYSVAVNVASIVVVLLSTVGRVLMPLAAGAAEEVRIDIVERTGQAVAAASLLAVLGTAACAPVLIPLVYGTDFSPAIQPLLILLPGVLALCLLSVVQSGLLASNQPGRASTAQLVGLLVTVVGLAVSLQTLGIVGAALTSSTAYLSTFVVAGFMFRQIGWSFRRGLDLGLGARRLRDLALLGLSGSSSGVWSTRWGR